MLLGSKFFNILFPSNELHQFLRKRIFSQVLALHNSVYVRSAAARNNNLIG